VSDYWQAPPQKRVTLTVRIPKDVMEHLQGVIELWRVLAQQEHKDPDSVNLTYVVERLLRVGVDGTWAQAAHGAGLSGMPRNKEEWEQLKAHLTKAKTKTRPAPK
jgi:hypothetical protein